MTTSAARPSPCPGLLDACTGCGACRPACRLLRARGTPRDIARAFARDPGRHARWVFECSLCGLCQTRCPGQVPVPDVFRALRREAVRRGLAPLPEHSGLLRYEALGTSRWLRLRRLPRGCRTVFFPGCALPGHLPGATWRLYRRLREMDPRLGLVLGCCGKPSRDLGIEERFRGIFGGLRDMLARAGVEEVLVACPSCHGVWRDEGGPVRVRTVYERLVEVGIAGARPPEGAVVVHDPCSARSEPGVHRAVRALLDRAGADRDEMPHREAGTLCCGEGGGARFVAPAFSEGWGARRAEEAGGRPVVTYCAGCVETLGPAVHTVHLLDVLFPTGGRPPRTFLRRLANRVWLKLRALVP